MAKIKRGLYILVFLLFLALPVVMYPYLGNKVDKENFETIFKDSPILRGGLENIRISVDWGEE